jgi:tRNA G37 N-methylase TrmD
VAEEISNHGRIALLCGRYEGLDERIREHLVTDEKLLYALDNALAEISAAARSVRDLTDFLERQPQSLLRGKSLPGGN